MLTEHYLFLKGIERISVEGRGPRSRSCPGSTCREEHCDDHREFVHVPASASNPVQVVEADERKKISPGFEDSRTAGTHISSTNSQL